MQSQSLKEYRWENRVIVIVSGEKDTIEFQEQYKALSVEKKALEDRDLILVLLKEKSVEFSQGNESQIDKNRLRKELKINPAFSGVILIGKDGGVKMRDKFYVEPQKIFDLIDSMPMRQAEMKN